MSKPRLGSLFLTIFFLVAVMAAVLNAQLIKDYAVFYQYKPDETIASFVEDSGMNDNGEFLFYVSQPSLENAETFNQQCEAKEETAAILGCYDGERIFIYNITDPRLAGMRPTTAAHEMLHAAYRRLSEKDKSTVNALLQAEYLKLKDDAELSDRMSFYDRTQPGDQDNELHSIIGTEISSISPELEQYYKRFFSDRMKVIAQHRQYQAVFEQLRLQSETLNNQIGQLGEEITNKRTAYDTQASAMQRDIAAFNTRANQGDFDSQADFNAERQVLMIRTALLESLREEINNAISEYNALVAELNSIAIETNALNRSINSSVEPAPSL